MDINLRNTLILAGCYLALFALGELLYHVFKVKVEITRKLVHIGTGLLALLFPILLDNHWLVLLLCASFLLILLVSLRYNLLQSINAIDRKSVGSLAYPVAVYGCYLMFIYQDSQYIYYYLPILILAISDPMAALAGKKWPRGKYAIAGANKTCLGSLVFFLSAVLVILCCWLFLHSGNLAAAEDAGIAPLHYWGRFAASIAFVAMIATVAEAVSRDGYDNITIPLSVLIALSLTKSWLI